MGEYVGMSKPEQLRVIADSQNDSYAQQKAGQLYDNLLERAKIAATNGLYEFTIYDKELSNSKVAKKLTQYLESDGFKVKIGNNNLPFDNDMYCTIKW